MHLFKKWKCVLSSELLSLSNIQANFLISILGEMRRLSLVPQRICVKKIIFKGTLSLSHTINSPNWKGFCRTDITLNIVALHCIWRDNKSETDQEDQDIIMMMSYKEGLCQSSLWPCITLQCDILNNNKLITLFGKIVCSCKRSQWQRWAQVSS